MTHNLESSEKSVMPILKTKHTAFGSRLVYRSAIWGAMRVNKLKQNFRRILEKRFQEKYMPGLSSSVG